MIDPAQLASLGPFFAVDVHTSPPGAPWRAMDELATDPHTLAARTEQVRAALAASAGTPVVEGRVLASVVQLGLVARIVAPVLGLDVLGAGVADSGEVRLDLAEVFWQPELGGPFPLSLPAAAGGGLPRLLDGAVRALTDATLRAVPVAPQVLWGNVASAVHSAGQSARANRPDLGARTDAVVTAALEHPLLRGRHERVDGEFRRRSCCLVYRVTGRGAPDPAALCSDCALRG